MSIVERESQLELLAARFTDCVAGTSSVTLLAGGVASGKTALLRTFGEHASASSALVLEADGTRGTRTPLDAVAQLFRQTSPTAELEHHVEQVLGEGREAALRADPADETVDHVPAGVAHHLLTALARAAGDRPLVVLVDDAHFVDVPSLQWLLYLARHLRGLRAMIVLGDCDWPSPVNPLLHTELLRLPSYRRLTLGPVSAEGVRAIVTQLTGAAGERLAERCHEVSGGNPLLVRALVQDLTAPGAEPDMAFRRAVLSCLHRGQPSMRKTAEAVALLDESGSPALVGKLLGMGADAVTANLAALESAGLLDGLRFRHRQARAAVLKATTGRAELHQMAAELLYQEGLPALTVAAHLLAAGSAAKPWQARVLEDAAKAASAGEQAAAFLELAYQDHPEETHRAELALRLTRCVWRLNPTAVVGNLVRLAGLPEGGISASLSVAAHLVWSGCPGEAAAHLDRLVERVDELDANAVAEVWTERVWLATVCPGMPVTGKPPELDRARTALALDYGLQAANALHDILHGGPLDRVVADAEEVLRAVQIDDVMPKAAANSLCALIYAERLDAAASWCDHLLEASARHRGWHGKFLVIRAAIAVRQGDLPLAGRCARESMSELPIAHWGIAAAAVYGILLQVTTGMGEFDEAAELAGQALPAMLFETCHGPQYLHARGRYYLETGRAKAALSDFLFAGKLMKRWGVDLASFVAWRVAAAEAYLALGEPEQARQLAEEQLSCAGQDDHRVRGAALRVLAAVACGARRVMLLRQAGEATKAGGDRLELARVLIELHDAYRAVCETDLAQITALQALQLAEECGALPLQGRLAPARRASTSTEDTDVPVSLTESEGRIAALAAQGHTNREIAGKLHVTMSTVEQHLTKVYRKLNVRHRKDLAARIEQTV